jgi:hypothetical protein
VGGGGRERDRAREREGERESESFHSSNDLRLRREREREREREGGRQAGRVDLSLASFFASILCRLCYREDETMRISLSLYNLSVYSFNYL